VSTADASSISLAPPVVLADEAAPQYQPFMEDWRGGYVKIAHPKCFAEAEGLDALLAAVERNDRRQRGDFSATRKT